MTHDIAFAVEHIGQQDRLAYPAFYDVLTGLANHTLFLDRVTQYLHSAATAGNRLVVYLLDVERFKNINDSLGQDVGEVLLKQVAQWVTRTVGDSNLVARVGADQFAILRPVAREMDSLETLLQEQLESFSSHPFPLNDGVCRISIKAAAAVFPQDGATADGLFKNAEAALKRAKASGKVTSAEALLRWNKPGTGLISPGEFIPILEETGLIHDVGRWVLRQALSDYLRWRACKLNAVAEGAETEEQARLLRLLGCDEMQGYLISKALPRDEFEARYLQHLP